jgi:hypothetical protein
MGIDAQCVKAASEINENRTVATAARKIQNINLMPGPSRIWMILVRRCECPNLDSPTAARKTREGLAIRQIKTAPEAVRSWRDNSPCLGRVIALAALVRASGGLRRQYRSFNQAI